MSNPPESWLLTKPSFTFDSLLEEHASLVEAEKRQIIRDRYGLMHDEIVENPELISRRLDELDAALAVIDNKESYETALFVNPEHVQSRTFRLGFLRADRFDANAAARRMVKYWERKVELFGTENAFKSYLSCLDVEAMDPEALRKGGVRLLPRCDGRGRAIIFTFSAYFTENNVDSMVRNTYYTYR